MNPSSDKKEALQKEIADLLERGDRKAIALAYQNYGNALFGIILRIVKSQEIAEEVLQDVFVKVWKNAKSYNAKKGRIFTWLSNIARNSAIDMVRSARFQRESKTGTIENTVSEDVSGTTHIIIKDPGLEKIIQSLDEKYRLLIEKVYFEGYSHRDLEKKLNIPLGTIKSRLRQAIKQLRDQLNDEQVRNLLGWMLLVFGVW